jgi:hypothetical protein
MFIRCKGLRKVLDKSSTKMIFVGIKKARDLDKVYNMVTNPITFYEITSDDIPNIIPYQDIINKLTDSIPSFNNMSIFYDTFSIDKDLVESIVSLYIKLKQVDTMDTKQKSLLVIKISSILYKIAGCLLLCLGIPKSHENLSYVFDYLNFILSTLDV